MSISAIIILYYQQPSTQELCTTTLMCQAYFSLFSTIAKMYNKISIEHIMPGVALCDDLSKCADDDRNAVATGTKALNVFSDNAQAAVRTLISKVSLHFLSIMFSYVLIRPP